MQQCADKNKIPGTDNSLIYFRLIRPHACNPIVIKGRHTRSLTQERATTFQREMKSRHLHECINLHIGMFWLKVSPLSSCASH